MLWMMLASALAAPLDRHEIKRDLADGTVTFTWYTEGDEFIGAGQDMPSIYVQSGSTGVLCAEWDWRASKPDRYVDWATWLREMAGHIEGHPNALLGRIVGRPEPGQCAGVALTHDGATVLRLTGNRKCFKTVNCDTDTVVMKTSAEDLEVLATLFDEVANIARQNKPKVGSKVRMDALRTLKVEHEQGLWGPSQIRAHLEKYGLKPDDPDVVEVIGTAWMR